jgi:hypothetical protein
MFSVAMKGFGADVFADGGGVDYEVGEDVV